MKTINIQQSENGYMSEPMDQYLEGVKLLDAELAKIMVKAQTLCKLTNAIICTKEPPDRNKVLQSYKYIMGIRAKIANITKSFDEVKSLEANVILLMLSNEKLDNFSHEGKLFFPSTKTYFSVGDRKELEDFVISQGKSGFSIFANGLSSEFITNYMDDHGTEDSNGKSVQSVPPPGITSFSKTTLNMRNK